MSEILNKAIDSVKKSQVAFCRFITGNDTGATGSHQSGFYIPKCAAALLFEQKVERGSNYEKWVTIRWQDSFETSSRFIYYGAGTRNEYRITNFGRNFIFLQEEYGGCLLIISKQDSSYYEAFVLERDEDIESFFALYDLTYEYTNQLINTSNVKDEDYQLNELINQFVSDKTEFLDSKEMSSKARDLYNYVYQINDAEILMSPDKYLLKWRDTEYALFHAFEEKIYQERIKNGFANSDEFISLSNQILNRRKSRAGKSLEHHLAAMFTCAKLEFEEQVVTEDNKKPDFIFPGSEAYHNFEFPAEFLTFLGVKTSCKDRWRQVLNEANRIPEKYLFTFQPGISSNQLTEMKHEKLTLVVPKDYIKTYPKAHQNEIESLDSFIQMVAEKQEHRPKVYLF
ncbi:MAG: restriction endonuclease [Bacteroidaceae bacterium]|nr:restriction endonuclease [Bacteroidaceae bacterium]